MENEKKQTELTNVVAELSTTSESDIIKTLKDELNAKNALIEKLLNKEQPNNQIQSKQWQQYEQTELNQNEIILTPEENQELTIKDRLEILDWAEKNGTLKTFFQPTEEELNGDLSALYFLSKVGKKYFPNVDISKDFNKLKRIAANSLNHFWIS